MEQVADNHATSINTIEEEVDINDLHDPRNWIIPEVEEYEFAASEPPPTSYRVTFPSSSLTSSFYSSNNDPREVQTSSSSTVPSHTYKTPAQKKVKKGYYLEELNPETGKR